MSWTKRVQHPSEVVKKGDEVDVLILNVDSENKRISLGLKQAQEDPWLRIGETYPVGTELRGRVMRLMDKGVVVDLGSDIEGFVPMSQLGDRKSTRLNSSHSQISYAVFCLKKKTEQMSIHGIHIDAIPTDHHSPIALSGRDQILLLDLPHMRDNLPLPEVRAAGLLLLRHV